MSNSNTTCFIGCVHQRTPAPVIPSNWSYTNNTEVVSKPSMVTYLKRWKTLPPNRLPIATAGGLHRPPQVADQRNEMLLESFIDFERARVEAIAANKANQPFNPF